MMNKILIACSSSIVEFGVHSLVKEMVQNAAISLEAEPGEIIKLLGASQYDILITDINAPGSDLSPFSIKNLLAVAPGLRILVLSNTNDLVFAGRYFRDGVFSYLRKNDSVRELRQAIEAVSKGKRYFTGDFLLSIAEEFSGKTVDNPFSGLSAREFDIALLLAKGQSLKEIKSTLNIHNSTASTHKIRLFQKLNIHSIAELVGLAHRHGLIKSDAA
jgi:two-component system invasion response regulator UvrY